jgi:hypothetical protein
MFDNATEDTGNRVSVESGERKSQILREQACGSGSASRAHPSPAARDQTDPLPASHLCAIARKKCIASRAVGPGPGTTVVL